MSIRGELKGDTVIRGFEKLRISGLTVTATPEEYGVGLDILESFMHSIKLTRNINANYNFEDEPDPNSYHNLERAHWEGIAANVAIRLTPDFNKQLHPRLWAEAQTGLRGLSTVSAKVNTRDTTYSTRMPRGSGNSLRTSRWYRWYQDCKDAPPSSDTNYMFLGDIDDYTEHFDAYLNDGETIASYTIDSDDGLSIVSSSNTDTDVPYRIEAEAPTTTSAGWQRVEIVVTTSDGRVEKRIINFSLEDVDV